MREVKAMEKYLEQAMLDDCRGLSAGRDYEPSYYADLDELVALAKVSAKYGYLCSAQPPHRAKARAPPGRPAACKR